MRRNERPSCGDGQPGTRSVCASPDIRSRSSCCVNSRAASPARRPPAAPRARRPTTQPTTCRGELGGDVDFVLDGGPSLVGVESTIVDVSGAAPRLLRPGGLAREELERACSAKPVPLASQATDVRAPSAARFALRAARGLWLVSAPSSTPR
ncbi:MAG: Sua5/YciO/YrdC/YwlC family protein [Myxococcaceae bacterium]